MTPIAYAIAVTVLIAAVLAILAVFLNAKPTRNDEDDEK